MILPGRLLWPWGTWLLVPEPRREGGWEGLQEVFRPGLEAMSIHYLCLHSIGHNLSRVPTWMQRVEVGIWEMYSAIWKKGESHIVNTSSDSNQARVNVPLLLSLVSILCLSPPHLGAWMASSASLLSPRPSVMAPSFLLFQISTKHCIPGREMAL